jgi:hypothetical protein
MDEQKLISDFIAAQLTQLHASAVATLPEDHVVVEALSRAITDIKNGAVREPVLPAGFVQEDYDAFLEDQVNAVFPDSTVEELKANITDVVGAVQNAEGQYVEVGSVQDAAAQAKELVEAYEEENGEELYTDHRIVINYKRLNGEALTETNVREILNHPMSAALDHLGNIQLLDIVDADTPNWKKAVFVVLEEGTISLKSLALNVAMYRGKHVFPGIGAVEASADPVNFV